MSRRLRVGVECAEQTVHVRDRHCQLGMTDQPERFDCRHALAEREQNAPLPIARERQPTVGVPQPRRSGGPVEPVRAGDRHPAGVAKRGAQPPRASLARRCVSSICTQARPGCDPERARREAVGGSKGKLKRCTGLSRYATRAFARGASRTPRGIARRTVARHRSPGSHSSLNPPTGRRLPWRGRSGPAVRRPTRRLCHERRRNRRERGASICVQRHASTRRRRTTYSGSRRSRDHSPNLSIHRMRERGGPALADSPDALAALDPTITAAMQTHASSTASYRRVDLQKIPLPVSPAARHPAYRTCNAIRAPTRPRAGRLL